MPGSPPHDLHDSTGAESFYDDRYSDGYMEYWPDEQKRRVTSIIAALDLPETGLALDFGCGLGVMTEVLRQALPTGWTVMGSDLSSTAVNKARGLFPECTFVEASDPRLEARRFDLVFTQHVLEHVYDLDAVLAEINALPADTGLVFHILPCGNPGSFEHDLVALRRDGIDPTCGSRFFYEDEGHLRRLTSAEAVDRYAAAGFDLEVAYFRNQHDGAIEWMTRSRPGFLLALTDGANAVSRDAARRLRSLRWRLLGLNLLRAPSYVRTRLNGAVVRRPAHRLLAACLAPLSLASAPLDRRLVARADLEWADRRTDPSGSEMFLVFRRRALPEPT